MDERFVKQYTAWKRSQITQRLLQDARTILDTKAMEIPDSDLIGAAKAHWLRKGGELVLLYLDTLPTVTDLEAQMSKQHGDPDYGAEDILHKIMNP